MIFVINIKQYKSLLYIILFTLFFLNIEAYNQTTSHHSVCISIKYPNYFSPKESKIQWKIDHRQKKITIGMNDKSHENTSLLVRTCIKGHYTNHVIPNYSDIAFIKDIKESSGQFGYNLSVIGKSNKVTNDCIVIFTITDIQ